jgi:hypothetical protein
MRAHTPEQFVHDAATDQDEIGVLFLGCLADHLRHITGSQDRIQFRAGLLLQLRHFLAGYI